MRRLFPVLFGLLAAGLTGCGPKEVTPLQRKQGASLASEASFALTLRDYARAEKLMSQAVEACPDNADYWLALGSARRRLDRRGDAKDAYGQALKAARAVAKRHPDESAPVLQQVYVLALLGQADDARATLEQARRDLPNDRSLRRFAENRELDRMLADPDFKQLAP